MTTNTRVTIDKYPDLKWIVFIWYLITGVSLYRLNLGLILDIKQKFQEKRRLGFVHQFEKLAAVDVTFRLGIIAQNIQRIVWFEIIPLQDILL